VTPGSTPGGGPFPAQAHGSVFFLHGSPSTTISVGLGSTVTIDGDDAIAGAGGLTKIGEGTLVLPSDNSYTGPTTVSAGVLNVNGLLVSPVAVSAGATLGGTGTITAAVTVDGTLSPGLSVGTLSTLDLSLSSGSIFVVEIDGSGSDRVNVTGGVILGATLNLSLLGGYVHTPGTVYTLIANDLTEPLTGGFVGLPEGTIFTVSGKAFKISYAAGSSGNDVVLTARGAAPTFGKAFGAPSIPLDGTTTLTFTLTNPNAGPLTGVAFSDALPGGLLVAAGVTSNTCGGTLTAVAGSSNVNLIGGTISASGSCTIVVNVTGTTAGTKENSTSTLTSTDAPAGEPASASLTVVLAPSIAKAFGAPSVAFNATTTLTFTITNANAGTSLSGVGFTDPLPAGLVVATPSGLAGGCGGGTITAVAGSSSVSLSGATLAAGASCEFSVNVRGTAPGPKNNTTSAVSSTEGGSGDGAVASLTVGPMLEFTGPSPTGPGSVTITLGGSGIGPACTLVSPQFLPPPPGADPIPPTLPGNGITFPHGLIAFTASGCTPGATITITVTYPEPVSGSVFWKYGPTAADPAPHWYQFPATVAGNTVTFSITDGGLGDADLVANGAIVDPSGIAAPAPIPALSDAMFLVLGLLLLAGGVRCLARRRTPAR
jgi:uncharacterized repeat protein (TIGR01451 family)